MLRRISTIEAPVMTEAARRVSRAGTVVVRRVSHAGGEAVRRVSTATVRRAGRMSTVKTFDLPESPAEVGYCYRIDILAFYFSGTERGAL